MKGIAIIMNKQINQHTFRNSILLLITATIWGTSFVAQRIGMEYVNPITFNGARMILGGIGLLPVTLIRWRKGSALRREYAGRFRKHMTGGFVCGVILFSASTIQSYGIRHTTVGKAGFITAFYIILVPLFSMALGKKTSRLIWAAVAIAIAGLYLISIDRDFTICKGDLFVLVCSFAFAAHIIAVDHYAPEADGMTLSCIQFLTAGIISLFLCIWIRPDPAALVRAWRSLLYAGVLSAGVGYTLQVIGQKGLHPAVASLLMSMESCISVIAGWLILHQALTSRELAGCALMFAAIVLADLLPLFSHKQIITKFQNPLDI